MSDSCASLTIAVMSAMLEFTKFAGHLEHRISYLELPWYKKLLIFLGLMDDPKLMCNCWKVGSR